MRVHSHLAAHGQLLLDRHLHLIASIVTQPKRQPATWQETAR